MRNLEVMTIALTTLLASCNSPPSRVATSKAPLAYGPNASIARAPLSPPAGYAPSAGYASVAGSADEAGRLGWHASPRWAAIKGNGMLIETDDYIGHI